MCSSDLLEQADWLLKNASKLDERSALPYIERARIAIRRKEWGDALGLLDKAGRMEPGSHLAWFVRGEMYEAQGHIFNADQEYRRAEESSPKDSKARILYAGAILRTQDLIASGAALEMKKAAEEAGMPAPHELTPRGGKNTQRRRQGGRPRNEAAEATASEAAESTEAPEVTEAPAESSADGGTEGVEEAAGEGTEESSAS